MQLTGATPLRIGIDIGGTFTDFVIYNPSTGLISSFKLLSSPENPAYAVIEGLKLILTMLPLYMAQPWLPMRSWKEKEPKPH
jgi:predicted NBD/HSP70 family sugar kinase